MKKLKLILAIGMLMVTVVTISACQNEADITFQRYFTAGAPVYQTRCQNCHGANGEGLGMLIPPLTDSAGLRSRLHLLPCFVKYGMQQPIKSLGKTYMQPMPAQSALSPIEIAQVLTYVTNSFGNKMGLMDEPKVSADLAKCN